MNITNINGLPSTFVEMARNDYEINDREYHVTSLLKGAREVILQRRHDSEISQDCSDMVWMLLGTAAHKVMEMSTEQGHQIKEARLAVDIDGYSVTGQFDLYDAEKKKVTDYKTCSVWKVIYEIGRAHV